MFVWLSGSEIHLTSSLVGFPCMKSKLNVDLLTACPSERNVLWKVSILWSSASEDILHPKYAHLVEHPWSLCVLLISLSPLLFLE